jgi:hypothetical protein
MPPRKEVLKIYGLFSVEPEISINIVSAKKDSRNRRIFHRIETHYCIMTYDIIWCSSIFSCVGTLLKSPCHEILDLWYFRQTTLSRPIILSLFEYGYEFAEIFDFKVGLLWSAVSMTPLTCGGTPEPPLKNRFRFRPQSNIISQCHC